VVAVVGVDAKLVDNFKRVLAPVVDVDEGVVQRRAVFTSEAVATAKCLSSSKDIGRDDLFQKLTCPAIFGPNDI
jgi:hypothetical protein